MEIEQFIKQFAGQFADEDIVNVKLDAPFRNLSTWDSMTGMGILMMVQVEYGVDIKLEDFRNLLTPMDVFEYIKEFKK